MLCEAIFKKYLVLKEKSFDSMVQTGEVIHPCYKSPIVSVPNLMTSKVFRSWNLVTLSA